MQNIVSISFYFVQMCFEHDLMSHIYPFNHTNVKLGFINAAF